jgi:hypothetical protein|tara:strand:- start:894 stop:1127 length:234 start_codon:yes stop_codon:yes gene_type:complete
MKIWIPPFPLAFPASAAPDYFKNVNIPKNAPLKRTSPRKLTYSMTWDGYLKAGSFDILFGEKDPRYPKRFHRSLIWW